ncbi:MAG: serine protease [Bdellovibrionales bacterium]|nr:trypsin-like peptidase domain-containing protein [Bdellovibrionales bacterium]NQZ18623.1 serine protease [Bdellovibrionales bacterium]
MRISLIILVSSLFSIKSFAFPIGADQPLDTPINFVEIPQDDQDYDFNGIVAMRNCSAAIVHFEGQPKDSKAYVLTNGHCTGGFFGGFPAPGEVIFNKFDSRSMNAFVNINERVGIRTERLVYGTMTDTDAALFRIRSTYADLEKKGVQSFELSSERPLEGEEIEIVSGYWRRGFSCKIEKFIFELHESDWVMKDSLRYSDPGCEVYGVTSGSPVIRKGKRVVVAVNNTGNESGQECTMNNPCEVTEAGDVSVIEGRGYGQQTYWFASCLDDNYEIDLNVEGCQLPKP